MSERVSDERLAILRDWLALCSDPVSLYASMSLDELIERRAADRPDDAHEVVWSSHQQGEK